MFKYDKVIKGITNYIDNEILTKIQGWQRWVVGAGAGMLMSNALEVFNNLKTNEVIKLLNVIDESNNTINVTRLYEEIKKQAQKSAVDVNIPMIGTITLNETDVEKLYSYIKNANEL